MVCCSCLFFGYIHVRKDDPFILENYSPTQEILVVSFSYCGCFL